MFFAVLGDMGKRYNIPQPGLHRCEEIIKRSRFIATVAWAPDVGAAKSFIETIKSEFPDATHNCWAYAAGPPGDTAAVGFSDDGEPHGTAGRPMLNALLHSGIGEAAVVVTRYFGGVKLGSGGLVRAYSGAGLPMLGAAAIRKALNRIEKRSDISSRNNPHEMHALRIACRRGRYVAELFGDALGRPVARLAKRLKALQDALGDIHDIDVRLEHLARQAHPPVVLTTRLRRVRKKCCKDFTKAWSRFEKPRFQQGLHRKLRQYPRKPGADD